MKTNNLLKLVQEYFSEGYFDSNVRDLLTNTSFIDDEIDELWDYVFKIQSMIMRSQKDTLTVTNMKKEVSRLIGVPLSGGNYNGSTVNKDDMHRIYQFITSLPKEYLKDRINGQ